MENKPTVSVIVPVYNVEKYLDECIKSIIDQNYKELEIILVNDGSTDSSLDICKKWGKKDNRIIIISQENSGLSAARNTGFNSSTGKYLIFIDSDDFWNDNNMISNLVSLLDTETESLDFIDFNMNYFYQNQNKTIKLQPFHKSLSTGDNLATKIRTMITNGSFPMSACTKIFRKDFLLKNNINFIKGIYSEDIPWFIEILLKTKNFKFINNYYYVYRKQTSGITSTFSEKKYKDLYNIIENTLEIVSKIENNSIKKSLLSFIAYEYCILLGQVNNFKGKSKQNEFSLLKNKHYLLEYDLHPKVLRVKKLKKIFGLKLTSLILSIYINQVVNRQ